MRNRDYIEETIRIVLRTADSIGEEKDLKYWDNRAAEDLRDLEKAIEQVKAYRLELYNRMQQLQQAAYHLELTLKRERNSYDNKVFYYVYIEKVADGLPPVMALNEKFPGTERHKAFARFEALKKAYPGIITHQDTEKKRWEK